MGTLNPLDLDATAAQLKNKGYCILPDMLDQAFLQKLQHRFSGQMLQRAPQDGFGESGGFITIDFRDQDLVALFCWPKTLAALQSLGFRDPRLHSFYVSAKPPMSKALSWHSDLFYKYEPLTPAELFLIYYLSDTSASNGCLRVIPGSHRWSRTKRQEHSDTTKKYDQEIAIPIMAGDLFIGDRRLLHATHANSTNTWRVCITIAYAPDFDILPEPIQSRIVRNSCLPPPGWWDDPTSIIDPQLSAILPRYEGQAVPIEIHNH
jgi:ectoine hydroxylase-related dioxygenase (phytanoyl-CoA dioxygenase family)